MTFKGRFNVIGNVPDRQSASEFLLPFHSNYGFISYPFSHLILVEIFIPHVFNASKGVTSSKINRTV